MKRFFIFSALVCLSFFVMQGLTANNAFAQSPQEQISAEQTQPKKEKIPDAYMDEATALMQKCTTTPQYNKFYNCDCMAAHMLDQRIKQGPEADHMSIVIEIQSKCKDGSKAAGVAYGNCLGKTSLLPPDYDPKDFCECYANSYGKIFENAKGRSYNSLQLINMQSAARKQCRRKLK